MSKPERTDGKVDTKTGDPGFYEELAKRFPRKRKRKTVKSEEDPVGIPPNSAIDEME